MDIRVKRDIYNERRLRVVWDEDGQSVEQVYLYTPEAPGLWTADQRRPLERELIARGIGMLVCCSHMYYEVVSRYSTLSVDKI